MTSDATDNDWQSALDEEVVTRVVTKFYVRAFDDFLISHFFMGRDQADLVRKQVAFTMAYLGKRQTYAGRPLAAVHQPLAIRKPHFDRRQVILAEVLVEEGVPESLRRVWLEREELLRPLIVTQRSSLTCALPLVAKDKL